jgi:hypothetical protein
VVIITLAIGLRGVFMPAPWRNIHIAVYAAFVGVVGESAIIDSDHWRHYFLLMGTIWGLVGASYRYRRARPALSGSALAGPSSRPLAWAGAAA